MNDSYTKQFRFQYNYMVMARVTAAYAPDTNRRLLIDATALDSRASWQQIPVGATPGVTRNYRVGQIVGLLFRFSSATLPIAVAHLHNVETDARYADPLPAPHENVDDMVFYHAETGAFIRHRSATSTTTTGGGDAQPAVTEITLKSGHTIIADETPGKESVMVRSASGHVTKLDDVAKTVTTQSAGGHKTVFDDIAKTVTTQSAGGHTFAMDDVAQTITHQTAGGGQTAILDQATGEIASVAGSVGVGDRIANLPANTAALAQTHLTQYSDGVDAQRLKDMIAMGGHILSAGIPNAQALVSILAGLGALTKLPVPAGSAVVKIKP